MPRPRKPNPECVNPEWLTSTFSLSEAQRSEILSICTEAGIPPVQIEAPEWFRTDKIIVEVKEPDVHRISIQEGDALNRMSDDSSQAGNDTGPGNQAPDLSITVRPSSFIERLERACRSHLSEVPTPTEGQVRIAVQEACKKIDEGQGVPPLDAETLETIIAFVEEIVVLPLLNEWEKTASANAPFTVPLRDQEAYLDIFLRDAAIRAEVLSQLTARPGRPRRSKIGPFVLKVSGIAAEYGIKTTVSDDNRYDNGLSNSKHGGTVYRILKVLILAMGDKEGDLRRYLREAKVNQSTRLSKK